MNRPLAICICVLIAVSLWWTLVRPNSLRQEARHKLSKSNGTLDQSARTALQLLNQIDLPSNKDSFLAARTIDLNGYEGRINDTRALQHVVGRYMGNLLDDDGLDWFEIDQIEHFADRHRYALEENTRYQRFRDAVEAKRPKMVSTTLEEVKANAANKSEAFASYVGGAVAHTDDPQNVHDSSVNTQLRNTYETLVATTPRELVEQAAADVISEVPRHANAVLSTSPKRTHAMKAFQTMMKGQHNATLGVSEKNLLALVWARSGMKENHERKDLMRDAFAEALQDMGGTESGGVVCSGGRCARLLESLLYTDQDDDAVKGVMTTEQIRNDVMERSNKLLQSSIEEFASLNNSDKGLAAAARAYVDPKLEVKSADEDRFKSLVKNRVEAMIQQEYAEKLAPKDLDNIRTHCTTAIESI